MAAHLQHVLARDLTELCRSVRLGNSGLKVSKIILGCMSYGTPDWHQWVLGEDEALEHIKYAYDAGINTFDTANVSRPPPQPSAPG